MDIEKETTATVLNNLRDNIENFDPDEWGGTTTVEELRRAYIEYKDIANTLTIRELSMLKYFRGCNKSDRFNIFLAAKKLCEAYAYYKSIID